MGRESLGLSEILNLNHRASIGINNLEWPRLNILLFPSACALRYTRMKLFTFLTVGSSKRRPINRLGKNVSFVAHQAQQIILLDIEDSISWVHSSLILGRLSNQSLLVGETDETGCRERSRLVGNDLDIVTLVCGHYLNQYVRCRCRWILIEYRTYRRNMSCLHRKKS